MEHQTHVACLEDEAPAAALLCKLLSDPTRLRLLLGLRTGERIVGALVRELRTPQPTLSHHLGLLRRAGLVRTRREGTFIFYAVPGRGQPGELLAAHGVAVRLERYPAASRDDAADVPA
jgi:ArsR family transcriptional regulator